MDFSENILKEYRIKADKQLTHTCRMMMLWYCLVLFLDYINVFILDKKIMLIWSIISWIVFFLPTLYCNILKRRVTVVARYVYLTVLVVHAGIQVAFLTYHTIIMLLFPLVVSCLYNKKCYVRYTVILSIPMIWVGHILSKVWCIVPNEPLRNMRQILLQNSMNSEIPKDALADSTAQLMSELLKYTTVIVGSLPMILVYPFVQKYFVKGIMIGSVKG